MTIYGGDTEEKIIVKITYMIGNGFDINAGLKTRFSDFFKVYCQNQDNDSEVIKAFKKEIGNNVSEWADFERKMGEYTIQIRPWGALSREDYYACIEDFRTNLVAYLEKEEEDYYWTRPISDKVVSVAHMLEYPFQHLRKGHQEVLDQYISQRNDASEVEYSFIVFNYTTIVDRLLEKVKFSGGVHLTQNGRQAAIKGKLGIIHLHGQLTDEVLLGIDNVSQIYNEELRTDEEFLYSYVKPISNRELQAQRDILAKDCIESSDIIIIYGMSIGATDETWWRICADWILEGRQDGVEHYLIVYDYNESMSKSSPGNVVKSQRAIRKKFLEKQESKIDEEKQKYMEDHILCALNVNI